MRVEGAGGTHVGQVRAENEDAFAARATAGLAVVADGMGGGPAGEVASSLAVEEVVQTLGADRPEGEALPARVEEAVVRANERIFQSALTDPVLWGMGSTVTAMVVDRESGRFAIGHVGDSRAYRLTQDGIIQLTRDQTWVQERLDSGELTPAEARGHPLGHILSQVLGVRAWVTPEVVTGTAEPGDLFLLCTDGITKVLSDDDLAGIVRSANRTRSLEEIVTELIEEANRKGAPDNVTVTILRVAY